MKVVFRMEKRHTVRPGTNPSSASLVHLRLLRVRLAVLEHVVFANEALAAGLASVGL